MSQALPLTGIRVLELGAYISGPYAAAILGGLGAEIVKVEPPKGGDPFRRNVENGSPYFVQYNAGKRSIAVDLKRPEGVALIKSLLPRFDVLIENSRPGKTAALGLGPDVCKVINPRLIYSSVSGFGDGGPWRDRAAYDSIGQSMSAFYSIMNNPGDPRITGTCVADLLSAIISASGILAALIGRDRSTSKEGGTVQTSLLEAMSTVTIDAMTQMYETGKTPSRESRHPQAQNFCLRTADGGAVTLHLSSSQKFWLALTRAMDRPDLAKDPRFAGYTERQAHYFELRPIVEAEFLKRDRTEWERRLIECDVPFAPVLTAKELVSHPQTEWLQLMEPERDGLSLVRPPWRFDGKRPNRTALAPCIGEHSFAIASEVCSDGTIAQLIGSGVIFQAAAPDRATEETASGKRKRAAS